VAELRGGSGVAPLDVKVDLRLPAYFPDDYLGDAGQKMDFYRRLARIREPELCDQLADEVRDRFGPLPPPVANLVAIHRLRLVGARCGIEEIRVGRKGLDFFFTSEQSPSAPIIRGLMEAGPRGLQFKAVDQFIMRIPAAREQALAVAVSSLVLLDSLRRQHE
jgi:transcription-repair coupling factor (superfamily II helicase)